MNLAAIFFTVCSTAGGFCENHRIEAAIPPVQCSTGLVQGYIAQGFPLRGDQKLVSYRCEAQS
jgi:hypothetical protein